MEDQETIKAFKNIGEPMGERDTYKSVTDFSIHFTLKGQQLKEIEEKFFKWASQNELLHESKTNLKVHSCTMPRKIVEQKGWDLSIVEFMESLTDGNDINWYYASNTIEMSRQFMLENLKKFYSVAIFIGELKDGVLEEYNIAKSLYLHTILIP